jgi:DNA-binding MarR family transcriptional regulator
MLEIAQNVRPSSSISAPLQLVTDVYRKRRDTRRCCCHPPFNQFLGNTAVTEQFSHPLSPALDESLIRRIQNARRARSNFWNPDLFADPAWDMLLELYACKLGQQRVHVGLLCEASAVPKTTALRWLAKLEEEGLVFRQDVPHDARSVWVSLTPAGSAAMQRYFASISSTAVLL